MYEVYSYYSRLYSRLSSTYFNYQLYTEAGLDMRDGSKSCPSPDPIRIGVMKMQNGSWLEKTRIKL